MSKEYGVARVSTKRQNLERQVRNITSEFPNAIIVKEKFTGTKFDGREKFNNLLKILKTGDTLIFDSVSRMSRNAEEGFSLYKELYYKNINLVFLKERYIDTSVIKRAIENQLKIEIDTGNTATDEFLKNTIKNINKLSLSLVFEQIKEAFKQAEKEVLDLHQKTSEGLLTAKLNGKRVGQPKGAKLTTKKSIKAKEIILKHSKFFDGTLSDSDCIKLAGISRNTFYTYKKQLKQAFV